MSTKYAFENLLRSPWELLVAIVATGFGWLCLTNSQLMVLHPMTATMASIPFFLLALVRTHQGIKILCYKKRLLALNYFSMATHEVPISKENLFVGKGFRWLPIHRQRLHLLSQVHHQGFIQKNKLYYYIQKKADEYPSSVCAYLRNVPFLPFKGVPEIGGKPWLHGVGCDQEQHIFLKQHNRNSHTVVFGQSRVGKTRLLSILVNQDIRNGEPVLVIDPKGDLEILQDMYCACREGGRLQDFKILHAGFPALSAKYNPLSQYTNISEIATRVTSAIQAEGEGKQFQDFAWKFLNVVATCLTEMGELISYQTLAFFVTRPRQLLLAYCDKVLSKRDPQYASGVQRIMDQHDSQTNRQGKPLPPLNRADAVRKYVANFIESVISQGNYNELHDSIIADLHHAAELGEEYYGKITASLGPVFDKINKTAAGEVFSGEENTRLPVIRLEEVIKRKQVVYIGLDAMSNKAMSEAVGQAVIADLISLCGRLYKEAIDKERVLNLYADEFSEIVRDEFVTLLNKAGGAGVRVTALAQTVNDIGVAFAGSPDKPKMLLGNFGTRIMMRVSNLDTARVFTECLEKIRARSSSPATMSNDRPDGDNGELFTTYNTDTITEDKTEIIVENDVFSLPKGQAFILTNGGELYKVRMPLPNSHDDCPKTFEALLNEVNLCVSDVAKMIPIGLEGLSYHSVDVLPPSKSILNSPIVEKTIEEDSLISSPDDKQMVNRLVMFLKKRIDGKNAKYHLNTGEFIFAEPSRYEENTVFITRIFLKRYCADRLISLEKMEDVLKRSSQTKNKKYFLRQNNACVGLIKMVDVKCKKCPMVKINIEEVADGNEARGSY